MNLLKYALTSILVAVYVTALGQAVASFDSPELLMGDIATIRVSVPVPDDSAKVVFPLLQEAANKKQTYVSLLNDTIEILVSHKRSLIEEDGRFSMRYDLSIQAFDSGRYELPPLEFLVGREKIASNKVELNVLPVKVNADDPIDDFTGIQQPFELNPHPEDMVEEEASVIILWIIGAAVLLALGAVAFFLYRKTGRIFPKARMQSPYEVALEKLDRLSRQELPQKGKTKEYYTRLSDILRTYLKKQFDIKTKEMTSSEILYQIRQSGFLRQYEGILGSILETSDFVKFAKVNPSEVENTRCMKEAVRFIESSKPKDETAEGGEKGGEKRV